MLKISLIAGLVLLFLILSINYLKVPIVHESESLSVQGVVGNVFEGSGKDIVIKLKNNDKKYYINRGLERGLNLIELKNKLSGNKVVLKYPDYWSPLDWDGNIIHISKLELGSEIIFNEFLKK